MNKPVLCSKAMAISLQEFHDQQALKAKEAEYYMIWMKESMMKKFLLNKI